MQVINKTNGYLDFKEVTLSPQTTYSEFCQNFPNHTIWEVGNGYVWVNHSDIKIDNKTFYIAVCFYHEQLYTVHFWFKNQGEKIITDWNEWTEVYELAQQKKLDRWLTKQIGGERQFIWGDIGAYYDPKSSTSSIMLNYTIIF